MTPERREVWMETARLFADDAETECDASEPGFAQARAHVSIAHSLVVIADLLANDIIAVSRD